MKRYYLLIISICFLIISPAPGHAEESKWNEEGELSYIDTGGNSDILTLSIKNLLKYKFSEKTSGSWKAGFLYGKSGGVKNAENYRTELRADHLLSERLYSSVIAGWLKDTFSGIDPRYYLGPAIGYKFLMGPEHFLNGEAGLDYVKEKYTDKTDSSYMRGRTFAEYNYAFSKKSKFIQSIEFLYDFSESKNYNINSVTAIISSLSDYLSLKMSHELKYDHEPVPSTLDKTDTLLAVSLLVNIN